MMDGSGGSKTQEPAYDIAQLQASYAKWLQEAEERYERNLTTTTARLAASGLKPSADLWIRNVEAVRSDYEKELAELQDTETYRLIQEAEAAANAGTRRVGSRPGLADPIVVEYDRLAGMGAAPAGRQGAEMKQAAERIRNMSKREYFTYLGQT